MLLIPGKLNPSKILEELNSTKKYIDSDGKTNEYFIFISSIVNSILGSENSSKIDIGLSNGLYSTELDLGKDGKIVNVGENIYLVGTEIDQRIINKVIDFISKREYFLERDGNNLFWKGYCPEGGESYRLGGENYFGEINNYYLFNGLRDLDEDIYLFSLIKKRAIFTSKFKGKVKYITIKSKKYAMQKSSITGFAWLYSLDDDKRIITDKDKIKDIKVDDRYIDGCLKVKNENGFNIGPFSMWENIKEGINL